jgi:hypothetical protein
MKNNLFEFEFEFECLVFNATFNNISAISWRPVSVVEAEYPERTTDPGQATGKLMIKPEWYDNG